MNLVNTNPIGPDSEPLLPANSQSLIDAVYEGNVGKAKVFIKLGADVNAFNTDGETPLHVAARMANRELVEVLLDHGANATNVARDKLKLTPFHWATASGDLNVVNEFIKRKVDINVNDGANGITPIVSAFTSRRSLSLIRYLISNGADLNALDRLGCNAIFYAAAAPDEETILLLIESHCRLTYINKEGQSLLHVSSFPTLLRAALRAGVNVNARDNKARTALHLATKAEVVRILLESGADPNLKQRNGTTALFNAAGRGDIESVRLLLTKGADPKIGGNNDELPYTVAEAFGHKEIADLVKASIPRIVSDGLAASDQTIKVFREGLRAHAQNGDIEQAEFVMKMGNSVEAPDKNGTTALMYAAKAGRGSMVEFLISNGANIYAANDAGVTALMYAVMAGDLRSVQALLKSGALVNETDGFEQNVLLHAVERANKDIITELLKAGADKTMRSHYQITPVSAARGRQNREVLKLLEE